MDEDMNNKVYVACKGVNYEGYDVLGVYTDPAYAHYALSQNPGWCDYHEIQVFDLNGQRLEDDPDEYFQAY